jgi:hypothetical protein
LSDNFPTQNDLKLGDALTPLLFKFALNYAIRLVQENQVGLNLNGAHQLLIFVSEINLSADNIDTINIETQIDASTEVGLEANTETLSICCCLVTKIQSKIITKR